jgi:hypothetical protein
MEWNVSLWIALWTATHAAWLVSVAAQPPPGPQPETPTSATVFKKLFVQKRAEQLSAVRQLLGMEDQKRDMMVTNVVTKISEVTAKARARLEGRGLDLGVDDENFPVAEDVRTALALIIENTAFLGDVLLRFPDAVEAMFAANAQWKTNYAWCLNFVSSSRLTDEATEKLIGLVLQEMKLVERDEDYVNPYRVERKRQKKFEELAAAKKKEKKKLRRGPRMSHPEL